MILPAERKREPDVLKEVTGQSARTASVEELHCIISDYNYDYGIFTAEQIRRPDF